MVRFTSVLLAVGLFVGLTSVSNAAWAEARSAEVSLVATINDNPAFQPVQWKVYRTDGSGTPKTANRHMFTLNNLAPGRYTAVAWVDGSPPRKRDFFVMADTANSIKVPLD